MRRTTLIAAAVFLLSVALIASGTLAVAQATDRAGALLQAAAEAEQRGSASEALRQMTALQRYWREQSGVLELTTSHDALADVQGGIADALICLETGAHAEFLRACAAVNTALERLRSTEAVRLMNLF